RCRLTRRSGRPSVSTINRPREANQPARGKDANGGVTMSKSWLCPTRRNPTGRLVCLAVVVALVALFAGEQRTGAQTWDSGSKGTDGPLSLTTPGTIVFDPRAFSPPLDPDGDNIYHFTTITIGAGVTVRLADSHVHGPVFWLASGTVQIDGT